MPLLLHRSPFVDTSAMNVVVRADDERAIEVLAAGLPIHHGAQLAVDITLRSAMTAAGLPCPNAARVNGCGTRAGRSLPLGGRRHRDGRSSRVYRQDGIRPRA